MFAYSRTTHKKLGHATNGQDIQVRIFLLNIDVDHPKFRERLPKGWVYWASSLTLITLNKESTVYNRYMKNRGGIRRITDHLYGHFKSNGWTVFMCSSWRHPPSRSSCALSLILRTFLFTFLFRSIIRFSWPGRTSKAPGTSLVAYKQKKLVKIQQHLRGSWLQGGL